MEEPIPPCQTDGGNPPENPVGPEEKNGLAIHSLYLSTHKTT